MRQMPAGLICGTSHGIEPWGRFEPFSGKNRGEVVLRNLPRRFLQDAKETAFAAWKWPTHAGGTRRATMGGGQVAGEGLVEAAENDPSSCKAGWRLETRCPAGVIIEIWRANDNSGRAGRIFRFRDSKKLDLEMSQRSVESSRSSSVSSVASCSRRVVWNKSKQRKLKTSERQKMTCFLCLLATMSKYTHVYYLLGVQQSARIWLICGWYRSAAAKTSSLLYRRTTRFGLGMPA